MHNVTRLHSCEACQSQAHSCNACRWNAETPGADAEDCSGHGTHIASVAAGNVFGVAKTAKIVSVRVLDCHGVGNVSQTLAGECRPTPSRSDENLQLNTQNTDD